MKTEAEVYAAAKRFREALENTWFCGDGNLDRFPKECCHHASMLLGISLQEQGYSDLSVVFAKHRDDEFREHVWLEVGDFVVDITADQFEDGMQSVIAGQNSSWHEQWIIKPKSTTVVTTEKCQQWLSGPFGYASKFAKIEATLASRDRN